MRSRDEVERVRDLFVFLLKAVSDKMDLGHQLRLCLIQGILDWVLEDEGDAPFAPVLAHYEEIARQAGGGKSTVPSPSNN